jgi:porphobilinogen synthase
MLRETELNPRDFIYPLFVRHGQGRTPIASMPGLPSFRWMRPCAKPKTAAFNLGIPAVILFGIPAEKDPVGLENFAPDGIVQQAIRAIKREIPEMVVVTDVCLCEYTDHGHCGILNVAPDGSQTRPSPPAEGYVLNDPTLDVLGKVAVSHAECGADIVAPSGMMDGMVAAIRAALDDGRLREPADHVLCGQIRLERSTARSAMPPKARPSSATAKATRWTRPTSAKRCAKRPWTWKKARIC